MYGVQHRRSRNVRELGEREVARGDKKFATGSWHYDECYIAVCIHYLHYCILVLFSKPEEKQVLGLHQPMGSPAGSGDQYDCTYMTNLTYRKYVFHESVMLPHQNQKSIITK